MCRFLIKNTCLPYNWKRTKAFWVILWRGTSELRVWGLLCQSHQTWLYKSLGPFAWVSSFQNPLKFLYRQMQEQIGELHLLMRWGAIYRKKTTTHFILALFYTWLTTVEITIVYTEYASPMIYFNFLRLSLNTSAISEKCQRKYSLCR